MTTNSDLKQQKFILHSSGAQKFEIRGIGRVVILLEPPGRGFIPRFFQFLVVTLIPYLRLHLFNLCLLFSVFFPVRMCFPLCLS